MYRLVPGAFSLLVMGILVTVARAETFDSDSVEIFYNVYGEGDPLVSIHG